MKNLEEMLNQKANLTETEDKDFQDRKSKELEQQKKDEEKRKNSEEEARNNAIFKYSVEYTLFYGFVGAFFGAVLGFGKGCVNYHPGVSALSEPFIYIPEKAFNVCLIGAVLGLFYGIYKGKNE